MLGNANKWQPLMCFCCWWGGTAVGQAFFLVLLFFYTLFIGTSILKPCAVSDGMPPAPAKCTQIMLPVKNTSTSMTMDVAIYSRDNRRCILEAAAPGTTPCYCFLTCNICHIITLRSYATRSG